MQSSACELLGELRAIARDDNRIYHVLRAGEHFGLHADQIAFQAALEMQRYAKSLEERYMQLLMITPASLVILKPEST